MAARMSGNGRVMLLIDADNVSVDVMEQAIELVLAEYGALHVRRAHCTAESAVKHAKLFKRLSIRPMVNLTLGKNCTDIALAVDAMDLVVAERPEVVVLVSSDSDFAPLVIRLREKGCRVLGIGQEGKTGEEATQVYDHFIDLPHRKARPAAKATPAKVPRKGRVAPAEPAPAMAQPPAAKPASPTLPAPAAEPPAARRKTRAKASGAEILPPSTTPAAAPAASAVPPEVLRILDALPALRDGMSMPLNAAAEPLRSAQLLAKNAPSTRLFKKYLDYFVLTPARQPNKVEFRVPGAA
jgi:uncharacterized protein (TIGR00288 family)